MAAKTALEKTREDIVRLTQEYIYFNEGPKDPAWFWAAGLTITDLRKELKAYRFLQEMENNAKL